ncbi:MAG: copper homeostasis protein CutC, partial [Oscillospiraceae bacterium]|nr:copper homeostasis protein CutC [Oscillospiraceae bacterium]
MKKSPYLLECCVDSVESAVLSAEAGASRLELCGNLLIGGTTPSLALFEKVREKTNIRIHVLLRPRFGDFLYSDDEFEILLREAALF